MYLRDMKDDIVLVPTFPGLNTNKIETVILFLLRFQCCLKNQQPSEMDFPKENQSTLPCYWHIMAFVGFAIIKSESSKAYLIKCETCHFNNERNMRRGGEWIWNKRLIISYALEYAMIYCVQVIILLFWIPLWACICPTRFWRQWTVSKHIATKLYISSSNLTSSTDNDLVQCTLDGRSFWKKLKINKRPLKFCQHFWHSDSLWQLFEPRCLIDIIAYSASWKNENWLSLTECLVI